MIDDYDYDYDEFEDEYDFAFEFEDTDEECMIVPDDAFKPNGDCELCEKKDVPVVEIIEAMELVPEDEEELPRSYDDPASMLADLIKGVDQLAGEIIEQGSSWACKECAHLFLKSNKPLEYVEAEIKERIRNERGD